MSVREMERFLEQWQMDARDLRRRMIRSPTSRERERWYALLLLAQGWPGSAVAGALERDPHTIGRWGSTIRKDNFLATRSRSQPIPGGTSIDCNEEMEPERPVPAS